MRAEGEREPGNLRYDETPLLDHHRRGEDDAAVDEAELDRRVDGGLDVAEQRGDQAVVRLEAAHAEEDRVHLKVAAVDAVDGAVEEVAGRENRAGPAGADALERLGGQRAEQEAGDVGAGDG